MKHSEVESMLEQLPDIADQALGGLNATPGLKARIIAAAEEQHTSRFGIRKLVPVICCGAAALVLCVTLPLMNRQPAAQPLLTNITAGTQLEDALPGSVESASVSTGGAKVSASAPKYRNLWADSSSGTFPLIGMDGKYYRLMDTPAQVSSSVLGSSAGTVTEYTREPALSSSSAGIMSNIAQAGAKVYEVRGMGGALVAAEVNGQIRLFQRVSWSGTARRKGESLGDTLQASGRITSMELSGVGTVTGSKCEQLYDLLVSKASYESSSSLSGKQSLLINLNNGLTLQLVIKNDKLAACGVWSCPEFIDAFTAAVQ